MESSSSWVCQLEGANIWVQQINVCMLMLLTSMAMPKISCTHQSLINQGTAQTGARAGLMSV